MGIYASGATVTITNCNLIDNSFGAYLLSDYETITGCNFSSNSQGLVIQTDNNVGPIVKDCAFSNNEYQGLYMDASVGFEQSLPSVTNCNFSGNGASGLELLGLQCVVDGCVFSNNEGEAAGGIAADSPYRSGSYLIQNCTFVGNVGGSGGGVFLVDEGSSISNCTFVGNVGTKGGGIYSANNDKVVSCSFTANTGENGAIYFSLGSESIVANSVCYGDNNKNGTEIGSPYIVSYSDVQGGATGTGNINADPLFVRAPNLPDYGDLHLKPHSPCIGAGTAVFSDYNGNINQNAPTTDKDGNTRPNPPSIGAYEIGTPPISITGVRLGLPKLVTTGSSRTLKQSVYVKGTGMGTVSGYWLEDNNQTQPVLQTNVDLTSGNWVKLADFQDVLLNDHTLQFVANSQTSSVENIAITGFIPSRDGWPVDNIDSQYTISLGTYLLYNLIGYGFDGLCEGFTESARDYYVKYPNTPPRPSTPRTYRNLFQTEFSGGNEWFHNHEAKDEVLEGSIAYESSLATYNSILNQKANAIYTRIARIEGGDPCVIEILGLEQGPGQPVPGHSVEGTAAFFSDNIYDDEKGVRVDNMQLFSIYDPNFPGKDDRYLGSFSIISGLPVFEFRPTTPTYTADNFGMWFPSTYHTN